MTIQALRRVGLAGAASVLLIASLPPAHAAPSPALRTLDVEIIDVSKNGSETTRFALAIDDVSTTKLSVPAGDLSYSIDARCSAPVSGAMPITFKMHRGDHRSGAPLRVDVDLAVAVPIGARAVIATASRPDGSRIEIAVRAH